MTPIELSVVPLTLTISLTLVVTFVIFYLCERRGKDFGGWEGRALLPLADEGQCADKVAANHNQPASRNESE